MPIMGSLGPNIIFSVSPETVYTLDNMKWTSNANYSEHKRHLSESLMEFTGNDSESFTFTLILSAFQGVKPMDEWKKLLFAKRKGEALRFCIGTKGYGTWRWVIQKLSLEMTHVDNKGNLVFAKVSVTLRAAGQR